MYPKTIIYAFVCLLSFTSYSQGGALWDVIDPNFSNSSLLENKQDNIVGTPYFYESFTLGSITVTQGQTYEVKRMNYNALEDQVVVEKKHKQFISIYKSMVANFSLYDDATGEDKVFKKLFVNNVPTYMEVLYEGKVSFYKRTIKSVSEPQVKTGYGTSKDAESRVVERQNYFLKIGDNYELLPLKNKASEVFADYPKAIKYIEQNKIKLKRRSPKVEDIKALLKFIDSSN